MNCSLCLNNSKQSEHIPLTAVRNTTTLRCLSASDRKGARVTRPLAPSPDRLPVSPAFNPSPQIVCWSLLCFSCSSSLHQVDALPAGTKLCPVASTEASHLRRIPPQNTEHGVVELRAYFRFFSLPTYRVRQFEWLYCPALDPPPPGSDIPFHSAFVVH
jgi:hypothetical protein